MAEVDDAGTGGDAGPDAPPGAVTVTFGEAPGTTFSGVTRDTFISGEPGETGFNYGVDDELRIERDANERGLLAFDLTAIPPGVTVLAASLAVTVTELPATATSIEVSRILEEWEEGTRSGSVGSASYIHRTSFIPWLIPGAGAPLSSSPAAGAFTPVLGRASYPVPSALVQVWIDTPGANRGALLVSTNDDSTRFVSSEGSPAADRPVLTITYLP